MDVLDAMDTPSEIVDVSLAMHLDTWVDARGDQQVHGQILLPY